jgi:hypothetical protein
MAVSAGLAEPGEPVTAAGLVDRFDPARIPRDATVLDPQPGTSGAR